MAQDRTRGEIAPESWVGGRRRRRPGRARPRTPGFEALEARSLLSVTALSVGAIRPVEGQPFNRFDVGSRIATFVDPEAHGSYAVTIDWGDGTLDPNALALFNVSGTGAWEVYSLDFNKSYVEEGAYTLRVAVADLSPGPNSGPSSASATGTVIVQDAPLVGASAGPIDAVEAQTFTGKVASFIDTDPFGAAYDYGATIDWGDGSAADLTSATFVPNGQGGGLGVGFDVIASHTYAARGSYTRTVTIRDHGASATASGPASVADAPISARGSTFFPVEGQLFSTTVATFTDANPNGQPGEFAATIDWGDGTAPDPGAVIAKSGGVFYVSGMHTYATFGDFHVSVSIQAVPAGGASAMVTSQATVADAPVVFGAAVAVGAVEDQSFTTTVATFTDGNPRAPLSDFTTAPGGVTIDWGDGSPLDTSAVIVQPGGAGTPLQVVGGHRYGRYGTFQPKITITDRGGASTSGLATVTVADAPLTASGLDLSPHPVEGLAFTGLVAAVVDANTRGQVADLFASINWGDGTSSIATIAQPGGLGTPFLVSGSHVYEDEGRYALTVAIASTGGSAAIVKGTATVEDAPLTATPATFAAQSGQLIAGQVVATFTDANPGASTADFTTASGGVTIDWGDGTPLDANVAVVQPGGPGTAFTVLANAHGYAARGTYGVTVTIKDKGGASATVASTATVSDPPLIGQAYDVNAVEGQAATYLVATFFNVNLFDPPTLPYRGTIRWGDGTADAVSTAAGSITVDASGQFSIRASHGYQDVGTFGISVDFQKDATGPGIPTTTVTATATVQDAPLTVTGQAFNPVEGAPFSGRVATLTDADLTNTAGTNYVATIDWGDGSAPTAGTVTYTGTPGVFRIDGTHTYPVYGLYNAVKVTVVGADVPAGFVPSTASAVSTAQVADAPLTASGQALVDSTGARPVEGRAISGVVATFTDGDPNGRVSDKFALVLWGDGTAGSPGAITKVGSTFYVTATHIYTDEGLYTIQVNLSSLGGSRASATSTADVQDAPLAAAGTAGLTVENATFLGAVALFTDGNPFATIADFAAPGGSVTIDWGDGSMPDSNATITQPGGPGAAFYVNASHLYADPSAAGYTVTVRIADRGGAVATATTTIQVLDADLRAGAPVPLAGIEGAPLSGVIATFTDLDPTDPAGEFTATIDWADGATGVGTVVATATPGVFNVLGAHTYRVEGTYAPVRVSVASRFGATTSVTTAATIHDAPLSADPTPVVLSGTEGVPLTDVTIAAFTSANPFDTPDHFTVMIDWGDGSASAATSVVSSGSTFQARGSHTYARPGRYPLLVSVIDAYGGEYSNTIITNGSARIADAPLTVVSATTASVVEGMPFAGALASIRDTNPQGRAADFAATIDWGDGTSGPGTLTQPGGMGTVFVVSGAHTYGRAGNYVPRVTVRSADGAVTVMATASITSTDAPLTVLGVPTTLTATEGLAMGDQVVATFQSGDTGYPPSETAADFAAAIDWGDGTTAAGVIVRVVPGFFQVRSNHTYAEEGTFNVRVQITSQEGPSAATSSLITVRVVDAPLVPVIVQTSQAAIAGMTTGEVGVGMFTDLDPGGFPGDYLATIDWGDGSTSAATGIVRSSGSTFQVLGRHTYAVAGTFHVLVSVADTDGGPDGPDRSHATIPGPALIVATPPLTPTPDGPSIQGYEQSGMTAVIAQLPDPVLNDSVETLSAVVSWGDGQISSGTLTASPGGGITVSGSHTFPKIGVYDVTAVVVDLNQVRAVVRGQALVADAPLVAGAGQSLQATEGAAFAGVVASVRDTDPLGRAADLTATIDWGDGTSDPGVLTQPGGVGTPFVISGMHTYARAGSYTPRVTVASAGGATPVIVTDALAVADAPLVADAGLMLQATEGAAFAGALASVHDTNPLGRAADLAATIDWGDGATTAGTLTQPGGVGTPFVISGAHTYARAGLYAPRVTVVSAGGAAPVVITDDVAVADAPLAADAPLTLQATEGAAFAGALASVRDANPLGQAADLAATIDWGDGTTGPGVLTQPDGVGTPFVISGMHTYARAGHYAPRVTVVSAGGASPVVITDALAVADAPLVAGAGLALLATEGAAFAGVVASIRDANPLGRAADLAATIDWGDGTAGPGVLTQPGGIGAAFLVSGAHTYARAGRYVPRVTVVSTGGAAPVIITDALAVADAPLVTGAGLSLLAIEGAAFAGIVASVHDTNPHGRAADLVATIDWGDGAMTVGTVAQPGGVGTPILFSGMHTYARAGRYTPRVTVVSAGGAAPVVVSDALVVADAPLIADAPLALQATEGVAFAGALASIRDTNPFGQAADLVATIDWGDGSMTAGTLTQPGGMGTAFVVSGAHTYARAGHYAPRVTVASAGGAAPVIVTDASAVAAAPATPIPNPPSPAGGATPPVSPPVIILPIPPVLYRRWQRILALARSRRQRRPQVRQVVSRAVMHAQRAVPAHHPRGPAVILRKR